MHINCISTAYQLERKSGLMHKCITRFPWFRLKIDMQIQRIWVDEKTCLTKNQVECLCKIIYQLRLEPDGEIQTIYYLN